MKIRVAVHSLRTERQTGGKHIYNFSLQTHQEETEETEFEFL
jgi:hypothetical protein